jgi:hypothetical protein
VALDGSAAPWAFRRTSHPTLTGDARRGRDGPIEHGPETSSTASAEPPTSRVYLMCATSRRTRGCGSVACHPRRTDGCVRHGRFREPALGSVVGAVPGHRDRALGQALARFGCSGHQVSVCRGWFSRRATRRGCSPCRRDAGRSLASPKSSWRGRRRTSRDEMRRSARS